MLQPVLPPPPPPAAVPQWCSLLGFRALELGRGATGPNGTRIMKNSNGIAPRCLTYLVRFLAFSGVACRICCLCRSYQRNTKKIM